MKFFNKKTICIIIAAFAWALGLLSWRYAGLGMIAAVFAVANSIWLIKCLIDIEIANKRIKEYNNLLKKALDNIKYFSEQFKNITTEADTYRKEFCSIIEVVDSLPEPILAVFQASKKEDIKLGITMAVVEFARAITGEDTIFLMRLNHKDQRWYVNMAGKPVYLDKMKETMEIINNKLYKMAKPEGVLIENSKVLN